MPWKPLPTRTYADFSDSELVSALTDRENGPWHCDFTDGLLQRFNANEEFTDLQRATAIGMLERHAEDRALVDRLCSHPKPRGFALSARRALRHGYPLTRRQREVMQDIDGPVQGAPTPAPGDRW